MTKFSVLFIYLHPRKNSALVQLISYQLCNLLLSLELKNHILETNSHCTTELLVCAVGGLTMRNLTYLARLLNCQSPTLVVSTKISSFSLFFLLILKVCLCKAVAL